MNKPEHDAVTRVLHLVDEHLEAQPQSTLTAGGGGLLTWGELRRHVAGAIRIMEQNPPRATRRPLPARRR